MKGWKTRTRRRNPMKILAVEDDPVARAVLRQALRQLGHEAVEAPDGESAWEILQDEPFRVVVSDWVMPRCDGLDLCRRIRGRVGTEYLYFILLTSRDASRAIASLVSTPWASWARRSTRR